LKKPQIVEDWERSVEAIEEMAPKCCWTCCDYSKDAGTCISHGAVVPEEFLDKIDECDKWNREPF
jgi:hypothetical protein